MSAAVIERSIGGIIEDLEELKKVVNVKEIPSDKRGEIIAKIESVQSDIIDVAYHSAYHSFQEKLSKPAIISEDQECEELRDDRNKLEKQWRRENLLNPPISSLHYYSCIREYNL